MHLFPQEARKEDAMSTTKDDSLLHELEAKAARWVEETLPVKLSEESADRTEVRKHLEAVADQWVQHNLYERRLGKEGTPHPGYHMYEAQP